MRVLVVGSGGREHALCVFINKSPICNKLFCIPGSDSIHEIADCFKINPMNNADIVNFCKEHKIDFVVVGPELPLSNGIVDKLCKEKITVFGPDKASSQLESSKIFMKNICKKHNVPTAKYSIFDNEKKALDFLDTVDFPTVIKADGLAAGKGVIITKNKNEAVETIKNIMSKRIFGASGENIIIEEFLEGEEISFFALVDTNGFILPLTTAQDHKKIGEGDTGLNTGGMGAYSPVPFIKQNQINDFVIKFVKPLSDRWSKFWPKEDQKLIRHSKDLGYFKLKAKCNWKFAIENYCESYHLPWVHPGLNTYSKISDHYHIQGLPNRFAGQGTVVYNPRFKGKKKFPCFPNWKKNKKNIAEYVALFPNVMLGIHKDHYYAYWLEPVNHAYTLEHMEIYYVGEEAANSKKFKPLRKQNLNLWHGVQSEDVHIIEGMQEGRNSPSYNGGNFSPVMDNPTHHFHKWVATNLV